MTPAERAARLHNMSAPPRATISFRALTPKAAGNADLGAGAGLRWVCRIDVPGHFWPVPDGVPRDIAERVVWAHTLDPERRLLAQALAEERGDAEPDLALRRQVNAMPADDLHESLREAAARTDPAALGLPAFGLLHPVSATLRRERATAMRLALAVLSRRRGGIFLRAADPLSPSPLTEPLDLWTTEPLAGFERDSDGRPLVSMAPGVVPAEAGTQRLCAASRWIPACAGMTGMARRGSVGCLRCGAETR